MPPKKQFGKHADYSPRRFPYCLSQQQLPAILSLNDEELFVFILLQVSGLLITIPFRRHPFRLLSSCAGLYACASGCFPPPYQA